MLDADRLGQCRIDLQGLPHVPADLWPRVGWTLESIDQHHGVVAGERRVGQRELRIAHDRALEEGARKKVVLFGGEPLTVAGLKIQIVRVAVGGGMAYELCTLVARQSHTQAIVHDRAGNLVLHVEQRLPRHDRRCWSRAAGRWQRPRAGLRFAAAVSGARAYPRGPSPRRAAGRLPADHPSAP